MNYLLKRYWEKAPRKVRSWYKEFLKSENYNSLSEEQKLFSENVIMTFAEGVYQFEFESPHEWDEHGVLCCIDFLRIKSNNDVKFITCVTPVLRQFFNFLYNSGYKDDGLILADAVGK